MRDIKFRAWDGDKIISLSSAYTKELISIQINDDNSEYSNDISTEFSHVILMQYTGLNDKNGVEIYEGDVVSYWNGGMKACKKSDQGSKHYPNISPYYFKILENKHVEIIYEAPSFKIKNGNPLGSMYLGSDEIEVVGNIYENPELLEVTD